MSRLIAMIKQYPYFVLLVLVAGGFTAYKTWAVVAPDPGVIIYTPSYTTTVANMMARGNTHAAAVPVTRFRPGDTMLVARDVNFQNKTDGTVTTVFIGAADTACAGAQWDAKSFPAPTRTMGRSLKFHEIVLKPTMPPCTWIYHVAINFLTKDGRLVRVPLDDVTIEVVK